MENLVAAARAAGLRHVVWSTLEDTREVIPAGDDRMPMLGDGYRVPHFDVKGGAADALFAESGLPTTYDQLRSLGFFGADELGNMFRYYAEFPESYLGRRNPGVARAFDPDPIRLTDFLAAHRAELTETEAPS